MTTGTVTLHRVIRAPAERIYRAFLDPAAMSKWLPPHGFTGTVHHLEARVGGTYRMSFTNFANGQSHAFGGEYLELVPNERIRNTDRFDDSNLPGEMQTTVSLKPVSCGTDVHIVQEGIPEMIPTEACYLGWQESLALLAQLVEAEVPAEPGAAGCRARACRQPGRGRAAAAVAWSGIACRARRSSCIAAIADGASARAGQHSR